MRHRTPLCILICISVSLCWFPATSQGNIDDPFTSIHLEKAVHFLAADGSDVEVGPGLYDVESADEWIRLVPGERRDAVLIEVDRHAHPLAIDYPLAMAFSGDSPEEADLQFVMLLLPGQQSLEATGTYSGIRPRGFNLGQAFNNAKKTATNAYNQASSTANDAASDAANAAQQAAQQAQEAAQQAAQQAQEAAQQAAQQGQQAVDQARQRTQQAAQQAQRRARQAASRVQRGVQQGAQDARAAALRAKRAVEQGARQVGQAIGGAVQTQINNVQNNPMVATLQSEIQTLEAVRKLNLEPLFACLRQQSGQGSVNVPQLVQRFVASPPEFANWLFLEVMKDWEESFGDIMAEQLQALRNPSRTAPQGPELIGMAFRSLEKLANKGPGGRCLMQFVRPHFQNMQATSGQLQQTIKVQGQRMFDNQVAPILYGSLSQQIGDLLSAALALSPQDIAQARIQARSLPPQYPETAHARAISNSIVRRGLAGDDAKALLKDVVPGLGDILDIKNAVLADQLLNPRELYRAASQVESLTKFLNNPSQRQQALSGVRTALDPNAPWTESLYIDIGMEIIRVVGKNYLDSEIPGGGSFLIRSAVETLDFGEQLGGTVAQSVAGLVPEVGGIASGVAKVIPDITWKALINTIIVGSVKAGAHYAYGKVIDEAKDALKNNRSYAAIQRHAGPLSALLRYLPSKQQIIILATTHTEDTRKALERYNRSVLQLAEAAVR
ncbi:MAG: hypothetical protein OEZ05_01310 [Nitrospirota bacterium]|nr:hypothetical protein [Nitrospirota bacterium]